MKVVQYCQHVLGLGHLFRSLAIASALTTQAGQSGRHTQAGNEVVFVSGGAPLDAQQSGHIPDHVRMVRLPELMMDEEFKGLLGRDGPSDPDGLEVVKTRRRGMLLDLLAAERPDVFLVELYPFGRRAFEFELLPALEQVRSTAGGPDRQIRIVCSLRDILVEKSNQAKFEGRVLDRLNHYFDALLVHADPRLQTLDETFSRVRDIKIPVVYTGYISPRPTPDAGPRLRVELGLGPGERLVVASAGGGKVGAPLIQAAVQACAGLVRDGVGVRLAVFTGPYMDQGEFDRLRGGAAGLPGWTVERFTPRFLDYLAACDLSLSMAGYNTTMNLLAAGAYGLVWPFSQNREQRLRAVKLAGLGLLEVLEDPDLEPDALARRIVAALSGAGARSGAGASLDLDGAQATARWLIDGQVSPGLSSISSGPSAGDFSGDPSANSSASSSGNPAGHIIGTAPGDLIVGSVEHASAVVTGNSSRPAESMWRAMPPNVLAELARVFRDAAERREAAGLSGPVPVFFRADDIGAPGKNFERMIEAFRRHRAELALAVVPAWLTKIRRDRLLDLLGPLGVPGEDGELFCLHQHGWRHVNNEAGRKTVWKKCEFGPARSYHHKLADLKRGQDRLGDLLPGRVSPIFTPPWNRLDAETLDGLGRLGFRAVSRSLGANPPVTSSTMVSLDVTVDLHTRKETDQASAFASLLGELRASLERGWCGVMLHHGRMEGGAFEFLDAFLDLARSSPGVAVRSMTSLLG